MAIEIFPPTRRFGIVLLAAGLARNLRAGFRVALFMPVSALEFRASPGHYATLVAFNFAVWVAASAARAGFAGSLDPQAAPLYLATVPLVLGAAALVAAIYRASGVLLTLAIALSAADPLFELVGLALPYAAHGRALSLALYGAFFAWIWAAALRAVWVVAGRQRPQLWGGGAVVTAMILAAIFGFPKLEPWRELRAERAPALADERLFHRQGELIERALDGLARGRPGEPEMYFVGFAPDGTIDVFLKELRFVKRLLDERWGAAGRSLALASGERALDELPIATVTNLGRALEEVGRRMNPDEDVLFLYLSAHGDQSHRLSAWQPPLEPARLTPTRLARLLSDSGIKWRVVVVSACYSGGFVEPLRGPDTLVITASAAERNSFGCEQGRDFTYFGQAFFRDALAGTRSFAEAFERARVIVARMEAAERLTPSQPQIALGAAIAARLKAFEAGR